MKKYLTDLTYLWAGASPIISVLLTVFIPGCSVKLAGMVLLVISFSLMFVVFRCTNVIEKVDERGYIFLKSFLLTACLFFFAAIMGFSFERWIGASIFDKWSSEIPIYIGMFMVNMVSCTTILISRIYRKVAKDNGANNEAL